MSIVERHNPQSNGPPTRPRKRTPEQRIADDIGIELEALAAIATRDGEAERASLLVPLHKQSPFRGQSMAEAFIMPDHDKRKFVLDYVMKCQHEAALQIIESQAARWQLFFGACFEPNRDLPEARMALVFSLQKARDLLHAALTEARNHLDRPPMVRKVSRVTHDPVMGAVDGVSAIDVPVEPDPFDGGCTQDPECFVNTLDGRLAIETHRDLSGQLQRALDEEAGNRIINSITDPNGNSGQPWSDGGMEGGDSDV